VGYCYFFFNRQQKEEEERIKQAQKELAKERGETKSGDEGEDGDTRKKERRKEV
jgi:DNA invertase Pin-like site-specific DNA recombinase